MEKETFFTGYCRVLDQSRMVELITEDGLLAEVDCCYESCIHKPNCTVARQISQLLEAQP